LGENHRMKKIVVIYYSQTGQLKNALDSLVQPFVGVGDVEIVWEEIKPIVPFPFPWPTVEFFDVMPECVADKPIAIHPLTCAGQKFDLIILGWSPWFLSPSLPTIGLFHDPKAVELFKSTPVVTITACRNMWIGGMEKVKAKLDGFGANLVGNIVLEDRQPNLISVLTVIGWLIKGKREKYWGFLPKAGVSDAEIGGAITFGKAVKESLLNNTFSELQNKLIALGAVTVKPNLMLLELRGAKIFKIWERFIASKGGPGSTSRRPRVVLYSWLLPIGIFILSPIFTLVAKIIALLFSKKINPMIAYYQGVRYKPR